MSAGPPGDCASRPSIPATPHRDLPPALVHPPLLDAYRVQLAQDFVALGTVERDVGFGPGLEVNAAYFRPNASLQREPVEQRLSVALALKVRIDPEGLQIQMRLLGMVLCDHADNIHRADHSAPADPPDQPRQLWQPGGDQPKHA